MFPDTSQWQQPRETLEARFDNACTQLKNHPGNRFWLHELIVVFRKLEARGAIEPVVEHVKFSNQ